VGKTVALSKTMLEETKSTLLTPSSREASSRLRVILALSLMMSAGYLWK